MTRRRTVWDDEVGERLEYFEKYLKERSSDSEQREVVDRESAKRFIQNNLDKDPSLSQLREGMDSSPSSYDQLIKAPFIKGLIEENSVEEAQKRLDAGVSRLRKRRLALEKAISVRERRQSRDRIVNRYATNKVLKSFNLKRTRNKNGRLVYRDLKGRFVKKDRIVNLLDSRVKVLREKNTSLAQDLADYKRRG